MEKITSHHQVVGLMEAYNAVHTPQINEDQVWEEVESWVNSLVEEGYDLSEYTWEDMYESYLTERYNPANYGTTTKNGVTLYGPNDPKRFSSVTSSRFDRPRNAGTPQYAGGGGRSGIPVRYTRPQIGGLPANYRGQELQQTARARASQVGTPRQGTAGGSTTGGNTPSPTRPAAATARPVAPAARPVAPAARPAATTPSTAPKPTTPKPVGSAMDQWAAANPKLAAAKAERDRTRGTSATTNPLMKDTKSSMPAPKAPAPSTASTGFGLAKKGVNLAAGVDIFDLVKGHLLDEGYADSEEGAMVIMVNMSEEWRKSILESHGVEILDEISKELALKAHAERGTREFESDSDNPKDFTKSGKSKADESERRIVKKHGEGARREANRAAEKRIYGHNKYSEAQEREQAKKKVTKEDLELDESSKTDDGTRERIRMYAGKKGISFEPGPRWDPSANRGKGANLSDKQIEKQRRKSLRNEDLESYGVEILDEVSKTDDGTRERIRMYAGKKGISFEPGPRWDPSANRGKGANLSPKQVEKQRRKSLRNEDLEAWVDQLIAEGYDLSEYTWEEVAEIYAQELELSEAQRARENPEDHDKEEKKKYEPVRGERTPMPPRGDKRREDFEKWYAKQMGR
jgi:hypothetical protein